MNTDIEIQNKIKEDVQALLKEYFAPIQGFVLQDQYQRSTLFCHRFKDFKKDESVWEVMDGEATTYKLPNHCRKIAEVHLPNNVNVPMIMLGRTADLSCYQNGDELIFKTKEPVSSFTAKTFMYPSTVFNSWILKEYFVLVTIHVKTRLLYMMDKFDEADELLAKFKLLMEDIPN